MDKKLIPYLLLAWHLCLLLTACSSSQNLAVHDNLSPQAIFAGYEVDIIAEDSWRRGFKGAVVLGNISGETAESFEIKFKLTGYNPIKRFWGGDFSPPDSGGYITLSSPDYLESKKIRPGESFKSGFIADKHFSSATVTNLKVNGQDVSGAPDPSEPTDPGEPDSGNAVFQQTFEAVPLGKYKGERDLRIRDCPGKGHCLRARYEPTAKGSPRLTFRENLPAALEYTLTYDLRFDKDFEWVKGGKLPGLAPANSLTGCGAKRDDGWSVRLMWRRGGSFMQYLYHQDKDERCGENVTAQAFTLEKDRWYKVALHVRVNSAASAQDGQVKLYVDGQEIARRDNLRLRNTDTGGLIERLYFSSFYGGSDPSWAPSRTTYVYFDNFMVYPGLRTR